MPKKDPKEGRGKKEQQTQDRESKILNIMLNTSILLMALMTDAFSDAFTGMASGMAHAVTAGVGGAEKEPTTDESLRRTKTEFPKPMIIQMLQMIRGKITDPTFDIGITIAERYNAGVPPLTNDLDEQSLLRYLTLLKANDASCTKMFQELMEWMKTVNTQR